MDVNKGFKSDQNIITTEEEKVERYQEFAFEIRIFIRIAFEIRIYIHGASKVTVIQIMIGALGSISKSAKAWYRKLDLPGIFGSIQL